MDSLSPRDRASRLETLFEEAAFLDRRERREYLDRTCANDVDLRLEVESLLTGFDTHASDIRHFFRGLHGGAADDPGDEIVRAVGPGAASAGVEDARVDDASRARGDDASTARGGAPDADAFGADEAIFAGRGDNAADTDAPSRGDDAAVTDTPETIDGDLGKLSGSRIRQYHIQQKLGRGGMGVVYRAHDTRLDRTVALKFLPPHLHGDADAQTRFIREARAASALDHTNICTIHEVGETDDGRTYIVMGYYEGVTLKRRLARGSVPVDEALNYVRQIARGLQKAHTAGIVHRDIKPANLLATKDGVLKILDFGIAKMSGAGLTSTGAPLGTVTHMSPEQARGDSVDHRTDVWSLGVVFYQLLTGKEPFRGEYPEAVIYSVLHEEPVPVRSIRPDISSDLESVVCRCLAKSPAARFQSMSDLLSELDAPSGVLSKAVPERTPMHEGRAILRRSLPYAVAAVLVAALILAIANLDRGDPVGASVSASASEQRITSVAVLPPRLISPTGDEEYFTAGMHDALVSALARIGALRVISRRSAMRYQDSGKSVPEIARELNVDGIVEASLYRESGRVHIDVRLIQAIPEERQLWAQAFDREFEFVPAMHGEVAQAIAREIRVTLSPEEQAVLSTERPLDAATYEAYLRGMFYLNKGTPEDTERGMAYLEEAVESDPGNALAYSGLALGYVTLGHGAAPPPDAWRMARAAAYRAVRLDSTLAEAWGALADVKTYFEWDWEGAEEAFKRADELNPSLAMNHYHYAWYLILFDRIDEALAEHHLARDLDPLTPLHSVWLPGVYLYAGRYAEALEEARRTVEAYPENPSALYVLGASAAQMGEFDEAIAAHEKMVGVNDHWAPMLGRTYAVAGRTDDARRILAELEAQPPTSWRAIGLADIHAALGNHDEAFRWLAYEPAHGWLPWSRGNPALEPLRDDPRFEDLLTGLGLPN